MTLPLKALRLFTDVGFLLYWAVTAFHWIPPEWAYQDYTNPLLVSWNWSFLPLDLAASALGLSAFALRSRQPLVAGRLLLLSLVLTSSSGLNALAFWTFRGEFDLSWWLANGFLLLWPLPYLVRELRRS